MTAAPKILPGLNHLFQQAVTGLPGEYETIAETLSPEVLTLSAGWIHDVAPNTP